MSVGEASYSFFWLGYYDNPQWWWASQEETTELWTTYCMGEEL